MRLPADPTSRDREIERLVVSVIQPLAERIVSRHTFGGRLTPEDAEDIVASVNLRTMHKLRTDCEAIDDIDDYVAVSTFNAINDLFRRQFPERARWQSRIRYLLLNDDRLALWSSTAGLAAWRGSADVLTSFAPIEPTPAMHDSARPADALVAILTAAGRPMPFDALVDRATELWNVAEVQDVALPAGVEPATDALSAQIESRDFLRHLWAEIALLPAPQRKALLLNLRDAEAANVVSVLLLGGVVTAEEMATALELDVEGLAAIWNDLPLEDRRIAEMMGLTRQQVINLRKSARKRLARRLRR